eukprot:762894-Hanusia_phi.AAC.1
MAVRCAARCRARNNRSMARWTHVSCRHDLPPDADCSLFWRRSNTLIGWNADPRSFAWWEVNFVGVAGEPCGLVMVMRRRISDQLVEVDVSVVMSCDAQCEGLTIVLGLADTLVNTTSLPDAEAIKQVASLELPRTGGMDDFLEVSVGRISFRGSGGLEERKRVFIMKDRRSSLSESVPSDRTRYGRHGPGDSNPVTISGLRVTDSGQPGPAARILNLATTATEIAAAKFIIRGWQFRPGPGPDS